MPWDLGERKTHHTENQDGILSPFVSVGSVFIRALFCLFVCFLLEEACHRKSPRTNFVKDTRSLRILVSDLALSQE